MLLIPVSFAPPESRTLVCFVTTIISIVLSDHVVHELTVMLHFVAILKILIVTHNCDIYSVLQSTYIHYVFVSIHANKYKMCTVSFGH